MSNVINCAAHIILCKYFGYISALVNTNENRQFVLSNNWGPWVRTFRPLPHMRSYIPNNHCQSIFPLHLKHSWKKSLNHLHHNRQRDQTRPSRDIKIIHHMAHKTPIYVVHPKLGVTSTKLQHHIIFIQKLITIDNHSVVISSGLHFRTPTHRVIPIILSIASEEHYQ